VNAAQQLKIVFTGPMGAGKTTAIRAISTVKPVSTEAVNNDQEAFAKRSTTVALDYGEVTLEDGTCVRLYGTPGQTRFSFMWEILGTGALGVILLIDGSSPSALSDLKGFVQSFQEAAPNQPLIVGVGRLRSGDGSKLEDYARFLEGIRPVVPVFSVDVRQREDVLLLTETLLGILEARVELQDAIR
jgi:signal recognition particle receptor subunit beta